MLAVLAGYSGNKCAGQCWTLFSIIGLIDGTTQHPFDKVNPERGPPSSLT